MGAESGMNSSVRDDRVALSDGAKALWGKTNRIDDSEWLPLYVHMVDSAAMASKIWDTWVPQGTKAVIVGDLGNDEVLARKLMIFMAGIHDIGKATPVFQAKSITFGPEAGSFAWKAERAGLPMIAGLRGTNHPTHPIAGEIILEGYLLRVRGWERKAARQYACVVGGHHGTPPDKSKIDEEKNRKTNVGLDSEAWVSTQDELIDFVANIAGIEEKEWEDLSERRFSVQSAVLMTGLVIMADWIASNSDEDMFPLVRTEPWADEDEDFFFSESGEEDDIQSWSGLRIRADRAWSCVQLPHAWVPEGIPSSCQDLFATRFTLPEGAKVRPVQEEAVRIARDTRQPGLMVIEAPMGEGKTEAALAAAEILAQRTGRGGVCVALPTMATTDAMFTRVRRWLEALPSCDFDNEKTVWLAHGKAQLNNDFRGIIAASHRRFSSVDQDDVKQESSQNRKKKQIDVPPETVVSDWLWGRKKGALANFLVCTVDQVLMSALQMKHVVLRQLAMANKVVIIDECHAYDAYMQEYLKMALEWLGGYRTPVILLSATLPECQRNAMVEAYLKGWCDTEPRKASKVSILEQLRARNASNTHHINHTANSEMSCEKGTAEKLRLISNAYPLLTYTDGHETKHADVKPSGRSMKVQCRLVDDDDTALLDLMDALLVDGGCIGVICDTVGRAQHAAELLGNHCGRDCVRLTHSRFMDIDRMSNERELRDLLGPDATIGNGKRPGKLVVVGTQVLEQSLDIDFDALVTDIAPVDLIMQRLGRVHRHRRGDGECDRPVSLQTATCYIRGVEAWNNEGPKFSRGADSVYDAAALMESLAVLDLTAAGASCAQQLPQDIARTVRSAYGNDPHGFLPHMWLPQYDDACEKRDLKRVQKQQKAGTYLLQSVGSMNQRRSLVNWFLPQVDEVNEDEGQRAVRDTQDTVEVLLLRKCDDGIHLLPWVGDEHADVEKGSIVPTTVIPDDTVAKIAVQCAVRLPMGLCMPDRVDALIASLEEACADDVACWQDSPWLAGKLALFLHGDADGFVSDELCGYEIRYSRDTGLTYSRKEDNQDIPVWEREDPPSTDLNDQNRFVGPVQAMTWQSRRVRLVPSEDNARIIGIMSCYGDVVAPYNTDVFEKMTAWRSSVTQQKKLGLPAPPHMPVVHDAGKALWRGLEPILCASDEGDSRPGLIRWLEEIRTEILESEKHVLDLVTIHAQGMTYGTQSSVFETGIDDTLSLNSVMFRHDYSGIASVLDVVKCTDGAVLALSQFVRNLRAASGDKGKSTETAEQVREWAYADLDGLFRDELAAFDETQDPIEYANAWKDEIHRRLLQMGWEYLDQSSVPVFGEHESGVVGVMGASRAQLLFQSKLNKELGFLEEKDASRPNKGGM